MIQEIMGLVSEHAQSHRASFMGSAKDMSAYRRHTDRTRHRIETKLRELQSRLEAAEKDANECRVSLLTQIHELADHIERAALCCSDLDMRNQMLGQREFALAASGKWNQNGNPFTAMQTTQGVSHADKS